MFELTAPALVALERGFAEAPEYSNQQLIAGMTEATLLLEREVKDGFPAVSGLTRAGIFSDAFSTSAGVLGVVGSNSIAAVAVELGTKPHRPPVEPILMWVNEKLGLRGKEARGVAFAIANKIAAVGTKAQHPFGKATVQQSQAVFSIFEKVAGRIAAHLAAGGTGAAA